MPYSVRGVGRRRRSAVGGIKLAPSGAAQASTVRSKNMVAPVYRTPFNLCQANAIPHGEWRMGVHVRTGPDKVGGVIGVLEGHSLQCKEGYDLIRSVMFVKMYHEAFISHRWYLVD